MKFKESMKKILERLNKFFFPGSNATRWMLILPYLTIIILGILLLAGGMAGWEYTNSVGFCGTACHTMPPQATVHALSPHSNVTCEECHIGRASFLNQLWRKKQGITETYDEIFKLYTYPIRAQALRPARETCEKCHRPETFSDDSLRVVTHFGSDVDNTRTDIYLILKTGGGAKTEGLGRGIHWHIVNQVEYYSDSGLDQSIPFVRVHNDDGTTTDYVDVESGFDPSKMDPSNLKTMDCVTCHNRVTHDFKLPQDSVDDSMARGVIDPGIPQIRQKAVQVLYVNYASHDEAYAAFDKLEADYKTTDYYAQHSQQVDAAIQEIKNIYDRTVFQDQGVTLGTYPNNLGHINSPGCFRCHDGKHLNADNQAIRLECNVCHSIPRVSGAQDFVTNIEISRGPEPKTHLNPNWISMHNQAVGASCATCHTTADPGGTSNTSFCSNSACHGTVFTYAGFDAPKLRSILQAQLPPPEPITSLPVLTVPPTYENYIGILFSLRCSACHGEDATSGLNLLTYATAVKGGSDGAVIVPNDSANSKLFQIQSAGKHFAKLSPEELDMVKQWIDNGAPEK